MHVGFVEGSVLLYITPHIKWDTQFMIEWDSVPLFIRRILDIVEVAIQA